MEKCRGKLIERGETGFFVLFCYGSSISNRILVASCLPLLFAPQLQEIIASGMHYERQRRERIHPSIQPSQRVNRREKDYRANDAENVELCKEVKGNTLGGFEKLREKNIPNN